jgi:flavoprotein
MGIADTLLSNAAVMGLKAFVSLYIMPSDYREGIIATKLPDGRDLKLRIRKEDVEHTKKLAGMDDVFVIEKPEAIHRIFEKHFARAG